MFIERIKLDFSKRKEHIDQHYNSLNGINVEGEIFNIGKIVLDRDNNQLHLYNVEWVNVVPYKNEEDLYQHIQENLAIFIADYLL